MHIYLKFRANFSTDRESIRDELFKFWSGIRETELRQGMEIELSEDVMEVGACFVDEPMIVEIADNHADFTLRTSNAGPGYHAALVKYFKLMAEVCPLDIDAESVRDETGYWFSGDFAALQAYMAGWLKRLAARLLEEHAKDGRGNRLLNIPHYMLPESHGHFACHSLGYLDRVFFEEIAQRENFLPHCRAYFIWWSRETDAEFHLKCALYIIWCRLNWLPPVTEYETTDYNNALRCLDAAHGLDPGIMPLPLAEWMEMARLIGDERLLRDLQERYPLSMSQRALRGYKRNRMMLCDMNEGWKLKVPGFLHMGHNDDGSLLFWDDARSVRISSLRANFEGGAPVPAEQLLREAVGGEKVVRHILPADAGIGAYMLHAETVLGRRRFSEATLFAAIDGYIMIVSVFYPVDGSRTRVMDICNSLTPPWVETYRVLD
jgi:hypothetical protein